MVIEKDATAELDATLFPYPVLLVDINGVVLGDIYGKLVEFAEAKGISVLKFVTMISGPDEDGHHPWHRLERGEIGWNQYVAETVAAFVSDGELRNKLFEGTTQRERVTNAVRFARELHDALSAEEVAAVNTDLLEMIRALRGEGVVVGVLTNSVAKYEERWRTRVEPDTCFDFVVNSAELGVRKPEKKIYDLAFKRVVSRCSPKHIEPQQVLYLDDLPHNCAAGRDYGFVANVVDSPAHAVQLLLDAYPGLADALAKQRQADETLSPPSSPEVILAVVESLRDKAPVEFVLRRARETIAVAATAATTATEFAYTLTRTASPYASTVAHATQTGFRALAHTASSTFSNLRGYETSPSKTSDTLRVVVHAPDADLSL